MADQSISQLPVTTTPLSGSELAVVVQNGITKQTALQNIANLGGPAGPVGPQGPTGPTGAAATIQVQSTTTTAPGTDADVVNIGSPTNAFLEFFIPRGDTGATGATGATGPQGPAGQGVPSGGTIGQFLQKTGAGQYDTGWADVPATGITLVSGTANQITVVDGSTSPVISLANNPLVPGTAAMRVPRGNTAERAGIAGSDGLIRFNTDTLLFEGYSNGGWVSFASGSGVTSITAGTGLNGGVITSIGTISIANTTVTAGSYGSSSAVPTFTVNAQGQLTAAANVTITPTSIGAISAVNGTANEITTSQVGTVVTVSLPSALTFTGKTVTGGTFNMTAATVGSDTVTTNTASQTLTNKTISGSNNTLSNIANSSLTNSSVTIGTDSLSLGGTLTTFNGVSISGSANTLSNIGNSSLTNSSITLGTTNIALGGTSLTPVGLTSVTVTQDPTSNFQLATKQYVDTVASTGIHYHEAVYVESPNTAGNLNATYASGGTNTNIIDISNGSDITFFGYTPVVGDQVFTPTSNGLVAGTPYWITALVGSACQLSLTYGGAAITGLTNGSVTLPSLVNPGVGATLTNAGTQVALTIDGVLMTVGKRVLIYNQTNAFENGVYTVTTVGTGSTNWVLTRATDADTYSPYSADALGQGDAFFVQAGATGAGETYVVTTTGSIVFGVTNISFAQISASQVYSAGTGLSLTGTVFSIANTAVTAGTYGTDARSMTLAVNAQGQITSLIDQPISIAASQINTTIPNSGLTNSSITINGSSVSLGGSTTVTATATNALTIGTGLDGTSYNGSTPVTINLANTAVTPGAYTSANITVDAQGRITSAANGTTPVTSFQTSLSGLTPSTATTGAVTLAGTLGETSGGTAQSTYTTGDILYASASNTLAKLPIGSAGQLLTVTAGVPAWGAAPATGVTSFSGDTTGLTPATATTGAITLGGTLNVANGGTGGTATPTSGGVAYGTGTVYAFTAAGSAGQVLTSNGTSAPTWAASPGATVTATSTNASFYPTFNSSTSGSFTVANVNSSFTYNPSKGELSAPETIASNGLVINGTTVGTSYTIAAGQNAMSVGPMTVASGVAVTITSGQRWVVL